MVASRSHWFEEHIPWFRAARRTRDRILHGSPAIGSAHLKVIGTGRKVIGGGAAATEGRLESFNSPGSAPSAAIGPPPSKDHRLASPSHVASAVSRLLINVAPSNGLVRKA